MATSCAGRHMGRGLWRARAYKGFLNFSDCALGCAGASARRALLPPLVLGISVRGHNIHHMIPAHHRQAAHSRSSYVSCWPLRERSTQVVEIAGDPRDREVGIEGH